MLLRIQTIEGYAAVDALRKGLKGNCYFVIKPDYNEPSSVAFWVRFLSTLISANPCEKCFHLKSTN
jgi:hypothetical protein